MGKKKKKRVDKRSMSITAGRQKSAKNAKNCSFFSKDLQLSGDIFCESPFHKSAAHLISGI